jgi:hypothetical protein
MAAFAALVAVVQEGDWGVEGWKGSGIGYFFGGPTIQVRHCCYHYCHHYIMQFACTDGALGSY